ncbi:MFS transporter [Caryophanon tenue]|nr:MFS transporter [Caryophanon tenue]
MNTYKRATYHLYTFLISKLFGSLGATVYSFGMSMYVLSATSSALSFAINMVIALVPRVLLAPFIGALLDRFPKKPFVIGGELGEILTITALLAYTVTNGLSVTAVYIATFFITIFATCSSLGFTASIANLVDAERLQQALSFNQISTSIASIAGAIIGGMLFGYASMTTFLIVHILLNTVTMLLEMTMNFKLYSTQQEAPAAEKMWTTIKEGLQYVRKRHILARIFLVSILINFFATSLNVGTGFILLEKIALLPQHIGFVEATSAIGMLLTSMYLASRKPAKQPLRMSKWSLIALGAVMMLFAYPLITALAYNINVLFYSICMFLFGAFIIFTNVPIGVILQTEIEEQYRGRVFGLLETAAMSMMPLATILFGLLYDLVPASLLLVISGLCVIICTCLILTTSITTYKAVQPTPPPA